MEEIFVKINGLNGYEVSNFGRVLSKKRKKETILKPFMAGNSGKKKGYLRVRLHDGVSFKDFSIHRLVAEAFVQNPNNKQFVNHIDGDKKNNRVENLEWCTYQYNCNYGSHNTKMIVSKSNNPVAQYDKNNNLVKVWLSSTAVERELGIPHSNIDNCCKKRYGYKTAGGFIWKRIKLTKEEKYNLVEKE